MICDLFKKSEPWMAENMIAVCDLCFSTPSHETVNLGFLYGVSLAYPDSEIVFYADPRHQTVLVDTIERRKLNLKNICFIPVLANRRSTPLGIIQSFWRCHLILRDMRKRNIKTILFLSCLPFHHYIIKLLLTLKNYSSLCCAIVLHGDAECLSGRPSSATQLIGDETVKCCLLKRLLLIPPKNIFPKLFRAVKKIMCKCYNVIVDISSISFDYKKSLYFLHSNRVRYVALSNHVVKNAAKYVNTDFLNIQTLVHPAVFHEKKQLPENTYPIFAIFGYGNTGLLQRLNMALAHKGVTSGFEIRIIGMDSRGTDIYPWVKAPIKKFLKSEEMEALAQDVDMFMILYEKSRYTLCCSSSPVEALSYYKPILYTDNDCINSFNDDQHSPIGICCDSVDTMAIEIQNIVANYGAFRKKLINYRKGIDKKRQLVDIKNNLDQLRLILTFS